MRIDAVYDLICPWCHVGKRHLDLALAAEAARADALPIEVNWRQFMLYPHFDRGGHDFLEIFRAKYGEALRVPMWDRIRAIAAPVGIDFAFERITRGPASIDGHRLVRWAEAQHPGLSAALIEAIACSFFEKARTIDEDFLVALAERHGLDGAAARAHLRSDADMAAPFAETAAWRAAGVTSVPHFVLTFADGRQEIIRDHGVAVFAAAFDRGRTALAA